MVTQYEAVDTAIMAIRTSRFYGICYRLRQLEIKHRNHKTNIDHGKPTGVVELWRVPSFYKILISPNIAAARIQTNN